MTTIDRQSPMNTHTSTATSAVAVLAANAAGMAAMDALITSIEQSARPDWRHQFDLLDVIGDPVDEIERLQRSAPTSLARAWLSGVLAQRQTYHPVLSLGDIRALLAIAVPPATRAYYAGQLMLALQTQVH